MGWFSRGSAKPVAAKGDVRKIPIPESVKAQVARIQKAHAKADGTMAQVDLLCSMDFVQVRLAPLLFRCVTSDATERLTVNQLTFLCNAIQEGPATWFKMLVEAEQAGKFGAAAMSQDDNCLSKETVEEVAKWYRTDAELYNPLQGIVLKERVGMGEFVHMVEGFE